MKRISALLLCLLLLGGCWDKHEIEDSTFAVLLGIDRAEEGLAVTIAFPMTQQQTGSAVEGMDNGSGSYAVLTARGATLAEAVSLFGVQLAGPLALHTVKTLVISQALAQSDMLGQVLASWRYEDIRNTANIVVSACAAQDFIRARVSDALIDPLRQEELLLEQANGSAFYSPMKLLQLLVSLRSNSGDGVAIYGGLAPEEAQKSEEQAAAAIALHTGYLPGDAPVSGGNRSRISGLAVFRGGRMVGVLDSEEAQTYALLTGGAPVSLTLSDPLDPKAALTVQLTPQGCCTIRSSLAGGRPAFRLEARLTCTVNGLGGADYALPHNSALLEAHIESICRRRMAALIDKLQNVYRADILRLGDKLAHHFATSPQWAEYGWAGRYPHADIGLTVRLDLEHTGVLKP